MRDILVQISHHLRHHFSMTLGALIVSFDRDAEALAITAKALTQRCIGLDDLVVVTHPGTGERVKAVCTDLGIRSVEDTEAGHLPGYIGQQYSKLKADLWLQTDCVLHVDSDTVAIREHSKDYWITNSKIRLYSQRADSAEARIWYDVMTNVLGVVPERDYVMVTHPIVHLRSVHAAARNYVESVHKLPLLDYLAGTRPFSEFNLLGHIAQSEFQDFYEVIDSPRDKNSPYFRYASSGSVVRHMLR